MSAYLIVDVEITDAQAYDEYKRRVAPVIDKFGGRFIVRGGTFQVLEGGWRPSRLVIIEFPDMPALQAWYQSPDYAPLVPLRQSAATTQVLAVDGC